MTKQADKTDTATALSGESPFPWRQAWSGENPFPWVVSKSNAKNCGLARVRHATAAFFNGYLFVAAEGDRPNPCYEVTIQRSNLDVFPLQFSVRACIDEGRICPQVIVPFRTMNIFTSKVQKEIVLETADGNLKVPVRQIADLPAQAALKGDHVPFPYGMPIRLGSMLDGIVSSVEEAQPREATGYSDSFSFDEAFRDAVRSLPPAETVHPDQLTTVTVTSVGALFGGIVGFNKMFVSVRAV